MKVSLFKQRVTLINVIILVTLGAVIGGYFLRSCGKSCCESFSSGQPAPINYNIGDGVPGSWESSALFSSSQSSDIDILQGTPVPLPEGEMFYFSGNKFSSECCSGSFSSYTSSNGCACMTPEQAEYLNQRGGNRTYESKH